MEDGKEKKKVNLSNEQISSILGLSGGMIGNLNATGKNPSGFGSFASGAFSGASAGLALGPIGGLIGGVIGGGLSLLTHSKQKKAEDEQAKALLKQQEEMRLANSKALLSTYPSTGVSNTNYYNSTYALGGKLNTRRFGGNMYALGGLEKINNTDMVARGGTHEQGGIPMGDAEVEGQEGIRTTQTGAEIYSNRLGDQGKSFGKQFELLAKAKKTQQETIAENTDRGIVGASRRRAMIIDKKQDELFEKQEELKKKLGLDQPQEVGMAGQEAVQKFPLGGKLSTILPYLDNISNSLLLNNAPQIPNPRLDKPVQLETDLNFDASRIDMKNERSALFENLDKTGSQNAAAKLNAYAQTIKANNSLRQQEINAETQLKNQNALNRQQVESSNLAKLGALDQASFQRELGLMGQRSSNFSNLIGDLQQGEKDKTLERVDQARLALAEKAYAEYGIYDRNIKEIVNKLMGFESPNPEAAKEVLKASGLSDEEINSLMAKLEADKVKLGYK